VEWGGEGVNNKKRKAMNKEAYGAIKNACNCNVCHSALSLGTIQTKEPKKERSRQKRTLSINQIHPSSSQSHVRARPGLRGEGTHPPL